jgi:hypothetical protein
MSCNPPFASAWQFSLFFCPSSTLKSVDNGGGVGVAALTDTQVNFVNFGVQANVGMILYNLTTGLSGPVTAVTQTTLTATGVLWTNGQTYRITTLSSAEIATINMYLDITAADISAALAATDSCSCTWQSWVADWLGKLNIIEAASFYSCSCGGPSLTDERKAALLEWVTNQLTALRDGNIAVCEGDSGKGYPAIGYAELNLTDWSEAEIIQHEQQRQP